MPFINMLAIGFHFNVDHKAILMSLRFLKSEFYHYLPLSLRSCFEGFQALSGKKYH